MSEICYEPDDEPAGLHGVLRCVILTQAYTSINYDYREC